MIAKIQFIFETCEMPQRPAFRSDVDAFSESDAKPVRRPEIGIPLKIKKQTVNLHKRKIDNKFVHINHFHQLLTIKNTPTHHLKDANQ